jgi:ABC-type nitrate/sulfonate/bicarbonate transport system substrate-binding protein
MADAVDSDGAELVVREPSRLSYSVLNVREDFLEENPEAVELVLAQYERARQWIQDNPDEAVAILAEVAEIDPAIAEQVLSERTNFEVDPVPGDELSTVPEQHHPDRRRRRSGEQPGGRGHGTVRAVRARARHRGRLGRRIGGMSR